jgi:hypothetical protein
MFTEWAGDNARTRSPPNLVRLVARLPVPRFPILPRRANRSNSSIINRGLSRCGTVAGRARKNARLGAVLPLLLLDGFQEFDDATQARIQAIKLRFHARQCIFGVLSVREFR